MFGRGCLDNIYGELEYVSHLDLYGIRNYIYVLKLLENHKYFLSKTKKYDLIQKYIALDYLEKMNLEALNDVQTSLTKGIKNITTFSKSRSELMSFTLNDIYKIYNYYQKFEKIIKDFQNINWNDIDEKVAKWLYKKV